MTTELIFAGFGGQGVLLAGQVVTYAGMDEGKHVSWLPSYGPEMRGGTAYCSVVVSDEEIASPSVVNPDVVVVMNRPSMEKFESKLKPGGTLIMNSDLIETEPTRTDIRVVRVPANTLAEEAGTLKAANMVALGACNECTPVVEDASLISALAKIMGEKKKHLIPINQNALNLGKKKAKDETA